SRLQASLRTCPPGPGRLRDFWPVTISHTVATPSPPPAASRRPSGRKLTAVTQPLCPRRVRTVSPLTTSQTVTQPPESPAANQRSSGLNATHVNRCCELGNTARRLPVRASRT